jgi:FlaG/FlaF family flagellin (archaellin)
MKPNTDTAVSPILATLLILLLTVVLFAVVASMTLNMGNTAPAIRMVSFTAHQEGEVIYVTYHGGPNQLDVADPGIVALVNEQEMQTPFSKTGHVEVGTSAKTAGTLGKDHVTVTVTYRDGKRSVALDTFV